MNRSNRSDHIRLTSHPEPGAKLQFPIHWGAKTARERGPIIGTVSRPQDRNVIGSHGGSYAVYRALAVSSGALAVSYSFTVAIALLATIYLLDIVATAFLIPEKRGVPLE